MILKKIAEGRYESGTGSTRMYSLTVEDWALQVRKVTWVVLVRAKSSANVKLGLAHREGITPDPSTFTAIGAAPIALNTFAAAPLTMRGTAPEDALPYFQGELQVEDAGALEWVDAVIYACGKPF